MATAKPRSRTRKSNARKNDKKKSAGGAAAGKKRQRLPAAQREAQIIEAATRLFGERGLRGTRTKDLADEIGVNEATLFLYFKTKEDIFHAAITEPLKKLASVELAQSAAFAAASDVSEKGQIGSLGNRAIYDAMEKMAPLIIHGLLTDQEMGKRIYNEDLYPKLFEIVEAAQNAFDVDEDTGEFIVATALGITFALNLHYKFRGESPDRDVIARRITDLFIHGINPGADE